MRLQCGPRCEPLGGAEARGSESACADSDGPKGRSSATPRPARPIPIPWTLTSRATKGWSSLPAAGLTCHNIFWLDACCVMDSLLAMRGGRRRRCQGTRLDADMAGIERFAPGHHRPQDARVLVGQGHGGHAAQDKVPIHLAQQQQPAIAVRLPPLKWASMTRRPKRPNSILSFVHVGIGRPRLSWEVRYL